MSRPLYLLAANACPPTRLPARQMRSPRVFNRREGGWRGAALRGAHAIGHAAVQQEHEGGDDHVDSDERDLG
eukprot:987046-Pleurochrysis_carterae.AAC.1